MCEHLQKLLGGNIRLKTAENACVLSFQNRESLFKIVKLLSGCLRSPKLVKFNILIGFLNDKLDLSLSPETADNTPLSSNSWLAGFIDADGSFAIDYSTTAKKFRIGVRLRIEQRMIDPYSGLSYETLFLQIAEFLKCNLKISTHNVDKKYFILAATSKLSISQILDYFTKFSLFSCKHLDYLDWSMASNIWLSGKAYEPENKIKIQDLKMGMNSKRTYYNWDHLSKLDL